MTLSTTGPNSPRAVTIGATVGGRFVDQSVMGTVFGSLIAVTVVLALFGLTATSPVAAFGLVFLIAWCRRSSRPRCRSG